MPPRVDPKVIAQLNQKIAAMRADLHQRTTALKKAEARLKQMMMSAE
ncbi:MAG: hypothetical protein VW338_15695 [Rhodospirillaceae bacterium]